ncbi:MAG: aminotransferase, partial [Deltaproteobacteria bacterium]
NEQGIGNLIHYPIAPHKQKALAQFNEFSLPLTEKIHEQIVSLPVSPVMSEEELERVITICNAF